MDKVTFVWPEWTMEAVESEKQNSVVYRVRRAEGSNTRYAAIKITSIPVAEGENRAAVKERLDAWKGQMLALRNAPNLLVPEAVEITPNAGGFTAEWNGSRVLVLHNPSNKAVVLDLNAMELAEFAKLSGFVGMGSALLEGSSLTLDAQTSAVLRVS